MELDDEFDSAGKTTDNSLIFYMIMRWYICIQSRLLSTTGPLKKKKKKDMYLYLPPGSIQCEHPKYEIGIR